MYFILGLAGLGVGGYLIYKKMGMQNQPLGITPYSVPNSAYLMDQPAQQYPYQAVNAPRVDNANQPWYGGNRNLSTSASSSLGSGLDLDFARNVQYFEGSADMIGSLASMWDDLDVGSWFDDEESVSLEGLDWDTMLA